MPSVRKSIIVEFTSEQMYFLVTDVASYPNFIKACKRGRVDEFHDYGYTATLEFEFKGIKKKFTTRNLTIPFTLIKMVLVSGPFKNLNGVWKFIALGDDACKVVFELDYAFKSSVIATISAPIMKHISETMVSSFYEEAQRKYGNQS